VSTFLGTYPDAIEEGSIDSPYLTSLALLSFPSSALPECNRSSDSSNVGSYNHMIISPRHTLFEVTDLYQRVSRGMQQ